MTFLLILKMSLQFLFRKEYIKTSSIRLTPPSAKIGISRFVFSKFQGGCHLVAKSHIKTIFYSSTLPPFPDSRGGYCSLGKTLNRARSPVGTFHPWRVPVITLGGRSQPSLKQVCRDCWGRRGCWLHGLDLPYSLMSLMDLGAGTDEVLFWGDRSLEMFAAFPTLLCLLS